MTDQVDAGSSSGNHGADAPPPPQPTPARDPPQQGADGTKATLLDEAFTAHFATNDASANVAKTFEECCQEVGTEKNANALLDAMRDLLPPCVLFAPNVVPNGRHYRAMYSAMQRYGVSFHGMNDSALKSRKIACAVYPEETMGQDLEAALNIIVRYRAHGTTAAPQDPTPKTPAPHGGGGKDPTRVVTDKYKHEDQTFKGDTNESWVEHRERFEAIAATQELSDPQLLALLPLTLSKAAGRYMNKPGVTS